MSSLTEATAPCEARPLRGATFLRGLHRVAPLGRKYHPLVSLLNPRQGLLAFPFGPYQLLHPAAWRKPVATLLLLQDGAIPEFRLLAPICRQLDRGCLVDVGANIGLYTLLLRAHSALPIIAYEPQPFLCDLIRRNVAYNRLPDIEVRNVACGAERGEVPFYIGTNGSVAVGRNAPRDPTAFVTSLPDGWEQQAERIYHSNVMIKVPLTTLDEDLAESPDVALLKIDCEGFEHDILRGARRLLERCRPRLFLELHPAELEKFGHSTRAVIDLLRPLYHLEFWCFQPVRRGRLARSLAKLRVPRGFQFPDAGRMLEAVESRPRPSQIYCIGCPR